MGSSAAATLNSALSEEGLAKEYGLRIGRTLASQVKGGLLADDLLTLAMRLSSAASDARSAVMYVLALSVLYGLVFRDVLVLTLRLKPEEVPVMPLDPVVILKFLGGLLGLAG